MEANGKLLLAYKISPSSVPWPAGTLLASGSSHASKHGSTLAKEASLNKASEAERPAA